MSYSSTMRYIRGGTGPTDSLRALSYAPGRPVQAEILHRMRGGTPRPTPLCRGCIPHCNWPEEYCHCGTCKPCPGKDCGKYVR